MKRSLLISPEEMLMRYPHLRQALNNTPAKIDVLEIPFDMAKLMFKIHLTNRLLKTGIALKEIHAILEDDEKIKPLLAELMDEVVPGTTYVEVIRSPSVLDIKENQ